MLHLIILAVVVAFALYQWFFKSSTQNLPPKVGPGIFATLAKMTSISDLAMLEFLHELSQLVTGEGNGTPTGAVFRINMPQMKPFIVSTDYKLVRKVLEGSSKEHIFAGEKSPFARAFDYCSTASLLTDLTASAERHKHRKHLAVSFSIKNLEYTQKVMKDCLQRFGSILQGHALAKKPFMLDSSMITLTLDIISESAFGVNFNSMAPSNDNIGAYYMEENELVLKEASRSALNPVRKYMFWSGQRKRAQVAKENMMKLAQNLIDTYRQNTAMKRQERDASGNNGNDCDDDRSIMGRLMSCEYATDESRAQDILIMLLGGHETSSHSVSYLILGLLRNPDAKKRLQAELDACISADTLNDASKLNCTEVMALPYLSQCIKESMRLWSVIGGGISRVLTQDIHHEDMLLPKGSIFRAPLYSMARQAWIDRPETFLPERWSDVNPQYAELKEMAIPFGAGQRQCIGQNLAKIEVAMIAAYTMRFFDFELLTGPVEQIFLTVKPVDMSVRVHLRA